MTIPSTARGTFRAPLCGSAIVLLAALTLPAAAETPATTGTAATSGTHSATLLNEVVVTATRTEETAPGISSAYTRIGADEIERAQIDSVKKAATLSPGVDARTSGADGGLTGISIRGNRVGDTLVLVDGVRAGSNIFQGGSNLLTYASSQNLEDVEIVRGAHSTLFGADAIGGVVALQTRRGSGTTTTTAFFEGGSFNTFREGIQSAGSLGNLDYSFHYAREDSSNDRVNNDLGLDSASLRLDYTINDRLTVGVTARTQVGEYQEPGSVRLADAGNNDPNTSIDTETTVVTAYAEAKVTDTWTSKLTLGAFQERYHFRNPFNPAGAHSMITYPTWDAFTGTFVTYGPYPADPEFSNTISEAANWSADWQNTLQLTDTNKLVLGATLLYQTGHDENVYLSPYYSTYSAAYQSETNFGIYAEDQWEIIKNLTLTGGLRYDYYELSGEPVTYRGGVAYFIEPTHTKLRASYGTSFKEATFYQSYTTRLYTGQDLDPERSRTWDAGVDQYLFQDYVTLGATFFHGNTRDLITYVSPNYNTPYYANRNSLSTQGVELSAKAKITDRWNAMAAYTYTDSETTAFYWTNPGQTSVSGMQRLYRIPRHLVSLDTNYTFDLPVGKLTIGGGLQFVGDREDIDFTLYKPVKKDGTVKSVAGQPDLADYAILRAYARYDLNARVAFTFRVENLADKEYEPVLGYPALGRAYYGGVQVTF